MIVKGQFRRTAMAALAAMLVIGTGAGAGTAYAQALAVVVNGDPITTADVDQQMILLRVLHEPSSRNDAIESLIADRLQLREANKFGIDCNDADLASALTRLAARVKLSSQSFAEALRRSGGKVEFARNHLHAIAAWYNYVRARNKGMSVSEEDINAALARNPNRGQDDSELTLQEVVFVTPVKATGGDLEQRMREAQALRSRFASCDTGLALARGLPNVAVKPPFRRDLKGLSDGAKKALLETPSGHLTAPERVSNGIQMIAICNKDSNADSTTIRQNVQDDLMKDRLEVLGQSMYKDLRATAVIERR